MADEGERGVPSVVFTLGGERYALAASRVLEVAALRAFTPLPAAAAPLFGLSYWRGDVLTVIDLRGPLRVPAAGLTDLSRLIVVEHGAHPFAFLADAAPGVVAVEPGEVQPLGPAGEGPELVAGVVPGGLIVIDPDALLRLVAGRA